MTDTLETTVLGFMFSEDKNHVLLINKLYPEWQRGKWNGLGGKIETTDLTGYHAMVREFEEECGLVTNTRGWAEVGVLNGADFKAFVFKYFSDKIFDYAKTEDELPQIFPVCELPEELIPAVRFLIPLALTEEITNAEFYFK